MNKPQIIRIGAGGHARSCMDVIEQEGRFAIAGVMTRPIWRLMNRFKSSPFISSPSAVALPAVK